MYPMSSHSQAVEHAAAGLPVLLGRALSTDPPGVPKPPGPRINNWQEAGALETPTPKKLMTLLAALWHLGEHHRLPDGTLTTTRQRPVPSAGGAYPVQSHLVIGRSGFEGLEPGRYVYCPSRSSLLHRDDTLERRIPGWPNSQLPEEFSFLVLTVQPGRSFGRYRHRAWPLWVADTAYAQMAVEFLLTKSPASITGPGPQLRELLGVPRAAETQAWLAHGLVSEIPLVAIELPEVWQVHQQRADALADRRSPPTEEFLLRGNHNPRAREVAELAEQPWIQGADRVETWSIPTTTAARGIVDALWRAHREAAQLSYSAELSQHWRCRPVSGIPAKNGQWMMHALAMISQHQDHRRENPDS